MAWISYRVYDESPYEHIVANEVHSGLLLAAQRRAATATEIAALIKQNEVEVGNEHMLPAAIIIGNCSVEHKDGSKLAAIAEQVEAGFQAARIALAAGVPEDIDAAANLIDNFDDSLYCDPERTVCAPVTSKVGPHRLFGGKSIKGLDLAFVAANKKALASAVRAKGLEINKNWKDCVDVLSTVPEQLRLSGVDEVRKAAAVDFIKTAERSIDVAETTMREGDPAAGANAKKEYLQSFSVLLAVEDAIKSKGLVLSPDFMDTVTTRVALGKDFYKDAVPCEATASIF
jgi:hypothetical protein